MVNYKTYLGNQKKCSEKGKVNGSFVDLDGDRYYKIVHADQMPPFLMTVVSHSDHWMYISSTGGLTAGRINSDHALFPYYTDDKIHESHATTGSKTIIRMLRDKKWMLWEPFKISCDGIYHISRNLYKNTLGNKVIFEEINYELDLTCRIHWTNAERYGWIKKTEIFNNGKDSCRIEFLDGLMNILPYGILKTVQEQFSTLMDAYKKTELEPESEVGIYSMASIPVDRAEPSESLKATTVWHTADNPDNILLSTEQFDCFRSGDKTTTDYSKKGVRGAYAIVKNIKLKPAEKHSHMLILETDQDSTAVHDLVNELKNGMISESVINKEIKSDSENLFNLVANADGIQVGGDEHNITRHFFNVLFNIMRGGIYNDSYYINKDALTNHVRQINNQVYKRNNKWFDELENKETYKQLSEKVSNVDDADLQRIILEYLPLIFSRRHGDPSRPWNRFSIEIKKPDGTRKISYQGNWRDIFQNWEALSWSYPLFLEGIITKFLNASTIDGYNPYRITDSGIDWEVFDPEDPWSFIGYWGDHQIIYLLKLLELQEKFMPGRLKEFLHQQVFTFVNVPYRIKPFKEILKDHHNTIVFDESLHKKLLNRFNEIGADGKLLADKNDEIIHVNMADKLLITLLTKLSNFIPEAGIWLNTQRPEWNDANNALVGNGVSMVTLYYLRRYVYFLHQQFKTADLKTISVSKPTYLFLDDIRKALHVHKKDNEKGFTDESRMHMLQMLGEAGSKYRDSVYHEPALDQISLEVNELQVFFEEITLYLNHTIEKNKREDSFYHSYNLIEITGDKAIIKTLPLMLEGQVAFLSSGYAKINEVIKLLENLKQSSLYRKDQNSYMLYPDKKLPSFIEKNNLPIDQAIKYPVIKKLLNTHHSNIFHRDKSGNVHFNGDFNNSKVLKERIEKINEQGDTHISIKEETEILKLYESLFNHKEFTGRSGSFFKYEGLGSIYWHMVSKLLLSVADNIRWFSNEMNQESNPEKESDTHQIQRLKHIYNDIREGLGIHKNPIDYGAFPTDPYSHTPSMMGAQQPGMTGQVKEDIISRWFELGIDVVDGEIQINPEWVGNNELDAKGELSFSFCGVPCLFQSGNQKQIILKINNGETKYFNDNVIDKSHSKMIFERSGKIQKIIITYLKTP